MTGRVVHGPIADSPLLRVQYWWSGIAFRTVRRSPRTVRPEVADGPPRGRGRSAWCATGQLSPLLLESCFRFGIVWGLFLGLVGPL
jgi:hypothetical protein